MGAAAGAAATAVATASCGKGPAPDSKPDSGAASAPENPAEQGRKSYAQYGEDIVIVTMLQHLGVVKPTFIDIGAHHPIIYNNTYLLYTLGARGVLVEPNPHFADMLKARRPEDTTLNIGIGFSDKTEEADYYVIKGDGALNTFSPEQVARYKAAKDGADAVVEVRKMPLVPVNEVLAKHFDGKAPDIFSIDVEGLDLDILKTLDFARFKPAIICVETLVWGTHQLKPEIAELIESKGYVLRGRTFVNSVFVDTDRIQKS
ncbi:MAG: FkbM family methyltransferase [Myxococcota bacterium]